jgi:hypothetical protein
MSVFYEIASPSGYITSFNHNLSVNTSSYCNENTSDEESPLKMTLTDESDEHKNELTLRRQLMSKKTVSWSEISTIHIIASRETMEFEVEFKPSSSKFHKAFRKVSKFFKN